MNINTQYIETKNSHKNRTKKFLILSISAIMLTAVVLFISSHSTHIKYNDWWIVGNSIDNIKKRYGEFDFSNFRQGYRNGASCGYYVGNDRYALICDNAEYYYIMYYDSNGVVTDVKFDRLSYL